MQFPQSGEYMKFIANIEQLHPILDWIREEIAEMEFDRQTLHKIELASEEVIINIIHHAYEGRAETVEVMVKLSLERKSVEIIFKDFGPPFNPLDAKVPDPLTALEEREIGGLGIYFVRQLMDEVSYSREKDQNVLALRLHKK